MREGRFFLDAYEDPKGGFHTFRGWTNGDRWNGWATPVLPKDEMLRLVELANSEEQNRMGYGAFYDPDSDAVVFGYEGNLPSMEMFRSMTAEEIRHAEFDTFYGQMDTTLNEVIYPIGSFGWTWQEEK